MKVELVRWIALLVLVIFSAYTVYCSLTENFWRACKSVWAFKWGRQVTADLFVGLFLFSFFVFQIEESALTAALWLVPTLILGNPVTLLYFVIHFDKILAHFPVG